MSDVASLDIRIATPGSAEAQRALTTIREAGAAAAVEVERFSSQTEQAQSMAARMFARLTSGADVLNIFRRRSDEATRAVGLTRYEMVNLGRQAQDVATMLALGASPMTILASQGMQVADVFMSSQGTLKGFGQQMLALVTPGRAVLATIAAAGAAAYGADRYWRGFALTLDDTRRAMGVTSTEAAKLQAAASFRGIEADEFATAMGQAARNAHDMQRNIGEAAELFRVNNTQARSFTEYLEHGADLVQGATSYQQKLNVLQALGLPATAQWVRLLEGGADGIRRATAQAVSFGGAANDNMVAKARAFDEAWNRSWTNFGLQSRSAVVTVISWFERLSQKGNELLGKLAPGGVAEIGRNLLKAGNGVPLESNFGDFYSKAAPSLRPEPTKVTIDPAAVRQQLQLEQQRLGMLGNLASAADKVREVEISLQLARMSGVQGLDRYSDALKRQAEFEAESGKLSRQTAVGIFDVGRQTANAAREMQTLVDAGVIRTTEQYADAWAVVSKRLREASESAAVARSPFENLTRYAQDSSNVSKQFDTALTSSMSHVETSFADIITGAKDAKLAFSDMASAILNDLARMVVRMMITAPLAKAITGAVSGMAGGFSGGDSSGMDMGSFHTGGMTNEPSGRRYVHPAYFENAPRFHEGRLPWNPATELPAIIRRDEAVFTPGQLRALGDREPVNLNVTVENHNGSKVDVKEETDSNGVRNTRIVIDEMVAGAIRPGSTANRAVLQAAGVRQRPKRFG